MLNKLRKYFNYSKRERQGVFVLFFILISLFVIDYFVKNNNEVKSWDFTPFKKEIDAFLQESNEEEVIVEASERIVKLFNFDPNTIDFEGLVLLGLSEKQARTLINFRKAGGVFNDPDDLLKVYGFSNKDLKRLIGNMHIKPVQKTKIDETHTPYNKKSLVETDSLFEVVKVSLNEADSIKLMSLKGIGPVYAKRIISYRNFLGGFCSVDQLYEVYGLNEDLVNELKPKLMVDTAFIKHVSLNNSDFKSLNKHPYLSFKQTKAIVNYRKLMGVFTSTEELLNNKLLDSVTYKKVLPYLIIN